MYYLISFLLFLCISSISLASQESSQYLGFDAGLAFSEYRGFVSFLKYNSDHTDKPPIKEWIPIQDRRHSPYANIYTGWRINEGAAIEVGAFRAQSIDTRNGRFETYGPHASLLFLLPLTKKLELMSGLGASVATVRMIKDQLLNCKSTALIPRLILGANYRVNDRWNLRSSITWHNTHALHTNIVTLNNMLNFGVGLNYTFGRD